MFLFLLVLIFECLCLQSRVEREDRRTTSRDQQQEKCNLRGKEREEEKEGAMQGSFREFFSGRKRVTHTQPPVIPVEPSVTFGQSCLFFFEKETFPRF